MSHGANFPRSAAWAFAFFPIIFPRTSHGAAAEASPSPRPDILFVVTEDMAPRLGCYGDPVAQTPNMDALAARGMRFDRAYCQFPLCNPSRSAVLSGLRPETTKILGNEQDWNDALKNAVTLPEYFRANGYETVCCGKIFHEGNRGQVFDDTARWERVIPESQGLPAVAHKKKPMAALYDDIPAEQRQKVYDQRAWMWGPSGQDDNEMRDGWIAEQAVRELSKPHERPLFLALGFHSTHLSYSAPDKYFALYPPEKIPLPQNPSDDAKAVAAHYGLANQKHFTPEKEREAIAAYYACISYVDACLGRTLDALRQAGRDKNTIVVFFSDHGFHVGEHSLWQKMTLYEESARVALMIAAPGVTKPGAVFARPVELMDLYPTLADLAGLPIPDGLECLSMRPVLQNPEAPWKKGAFTTLGRKGSSVRTDRWRYTEWGGPDNADLYDHETDPGEFVNLAKDPAHADTAARLSRLLHGGWRAALP